MENENMQIVKELHESMEVASNANDYMSFSLQQCEKLEWVIKIAEEVQK